jgi:imidazolonepropionase
MRILFSNIKQLVQIENYLETKKIIQGLDMRNLNILDNAYLITENDKILAFGKMDDLDTNIHFDKTMHCEGRFIIPTWCDSHTHLVFAHSREHEFVDRIHGLSYEEIAKRGGGILNSAQRLNDTSEEELFDKAQRRLQELIQLGTGAIEIKSGYGLNTEAELKMLRVIRRLKEKNSVSIKSSFLAAHAYPLAYRENHAAYIKIIINEMLPKVADENLADYIDVFCEKGFFSPEETDEILTAGAKYNLKPKIHANQLYNSGGIQVGVKHKAVSVDHLETMDDEEITCLQNSNTIATLLPGAAFFLAMHYQPARKIIDANIPVALASDFNPGSCPSGNMNLIVSLACSQMKMTPEETINACTLNGAAALELSEHIGSISIGKKANFFITQPMPSLAYLPYSFGSNLIDKVIINGILQ